MGCGIISSHSSVVYVVLALPLDTVILLFTKVGFRLYPMDVSSCRAPFCLPHLGIKKDRRINPVKWNWRVLIWVRLISLRPPPPPPPHAHGPPQPTPPTTKNIYIKKNPLLKIKWNKFWLAKWTPPIAHMIQSFKLTKLPNVTVQLGLKQHNNSLIYLQKRFNFFFD